MSTDDKTPQTLSVDCPFCSGTLVIDVATGEILESHAHKAAGRDFDAVMETVQSGEKQREELFERAFKSEQTREEVLLKKFKRAQGKTTGQDPDPLDSL